MHRQSPHQAGQAVGKPGLEGRRSRAMSPRAPRHSRAERKQSAGGRGEIGLERGPVRHDLGLDVEVAGIDQRVDARARQLAARNAAPIASATGCPVASPLCRAVDRFAPPLQADHAEPGLAHDFGDAGKLDIQGNEGEEIVAGLARCEQRGKSCDRDRLTARCVLPCRPARPHARSARLARIRYGPPPVLFPWRSPVLRSTPRAARRE